MELKQIKELMTAMSRTGIKRLCLKKDGFELEVEKEANSGYKSNLESIDFSEEIPGQTENMRRANIAFSKAKESSSTLSGVPLVPETTREETAHVFVESPMVGTFYPAPSPDDPSFVKVGEKIEKNTVVCIIEAMKVMNEVKAGVTGTVAEVLIESGQPVEFGTKLFRISS